MGQKRNLSLKIEEHFIFTEDDRKELVYFEQFFQWAGFKRIDGTIFGLLTLSDAPLASDEIQQLLSLSQSATSVALKNLKNYGLIDTFDNREKKMKMHATKEDTLQAVASILRKREQQTVEDFRLSAERLLKRKKETASDSSPATKRLESIISTCQLAETMMKLIISLSQSAALGKNKSFTSISKLVPSVFNLMGHGKDALSDLIKDGLLRLHLLSSEEEDIERKH